MGAELRTDGPDEKHGSCRCARHFAGEITDTADWCCCCDPCLHVVEIAAGRDKCCRCLPQSLCFMFAPDDTADSCCATLGVNATIDQSLGQIRWVAQFPGFTIELSIGSKIPIAGEPCYWRLNSSHLGIDEYYLIDHKVVTCLGPPDIEIFDVLIPSAELSGHFCSGTVTIEGYEIAKVPFKATDPAPSKLPDLTLTNSPCNCTTIAQRLCVGGKRHSGGNVEYVIFSLVDATADASNIHWEYLPPGGQPTDTERIYLRGDGYGNCYLEFDSDATTPTKDDWGELIPITGCGCDINARSTIADGDGFRTITINSAPTGECGRWRYICGQCRCVPRKMCMIGNINGVSIREVVSWDGEGWIGTNYSFTLAQDETGHCVIAVDANTANPFRKSSQVRSGRNLTFEAYADWDASEPTRYNWLWGSAYLCGCSTFQCGICKTDRCDGPPKVLTVTLQDGYRFNQMLNPGAVDWTCSWTAEVKIWNRIMYAGGEECGYIGWTTYSCTHTDTGLTLNWLVRVEILGSGGSFILHVSYYDLNNVGAFVKTDVYPDDLKNPQYCQPYFYTRHYSLDSNDLVGPWWTLTVSE